MTDVPLPIFDFDELDSTNNRARELARTHPGEPLVVTAGRQTAGRGRTGRAWASPRGGAWFTLVWPLMLAKFETRDSPAPDPYAAAPLVAGLAVAETLAELAGPSAAAFVKLKWPNDVLIAGRKVAGILCERTEIGVMGPEPSARGPLLVGVGINADLALAELPADLRASATTLQAAWGRAVDVAALIRRCAQGIARRLAELQAAGLSPAVHAAITARLAYRGERITLESGGRAFQGRCQGIDEAGALLLATTGQVVALTAGEVHHLTPR